ncbi:MAG: hypothetical protein OXF02_05140 [Simkaniaceae bacterium]|nr:hypothetical protein [Simkaniaceae bacterium]
METKEISHPNRGGRKKGWRKEPDTKPGNSVDLFITTIGISNKLLADELGVSTKTVAKYRKDMSFHTDAFFDAVRSSMRFLVYNKGKKIPDRWWEELEFLRGTAGVIKKCLCRKN